MTPINNVSRHGTRRKYLNALVMGIVCLACSRFGIALTVGEISINVPWSIIFPLLAAMAYGSRYGFVAAVSGGALFPFLLWANNGWANVLNFFLLSLFYVSIGSLNGLTIVKGKYSVAVRLAAVLVLFSLVMSLSYLYVFNWFLQFNPPFWVQSAASSIDNGILYVFVVKDTINFIVLAVMAEVFLCLPPVRTFFGLPVEANMAANTKIAISTTFFSAILWAVFTLLEVFLAGDSAIVHHDPKQVNLFMLAVGGLLAGRVIIQFAQKRFDVEHALQEHVDALGSSEARLKKTQELAHLGSWELDIASGTLIWSDEVFHIFGLRSQEFTPTYENFLEVIHPDDRAAVSMAYGESMRLGNDGYEIVHRIVRRSTGEVRFVYERCEHQRDTSGRIVRSVGMVLDITDRKSAEQVLLEKSEEVERYFASSLDMLCIAGIDGRFIRLNPEWEKVLGYTLAELEGRIFLEFVHPDDMQSTLNAISKLGAGEPVLSFENRYRAKDGSYRWIEWRSQPQGELIYAAARDISDRKLADKKLRESEETLRAITTNIPDSILQCDRSGRIRYVNRIPVDMTREQILSSTLLDIVPPDHRPTVERALHAAFLEGKTTIFETTGPEHDGRVRSYEVCASPIVVGETVVSAVFLARDITERKNAEQLVRDMQRRESIGILSGGIAHDFNNLLGVMLGNVSLAQEQLPADHPAAKNIEKAVAAMERAAHLTRQMLAYSGKGKFQNIMIDIASVIREHASLFGVSLPKNVKLTTHLPSTPLFVNGDSGQIEQIVMNLIINGGEAIGDRQGMVTVTLTAVTLGRDELLPFGRLTNSTLDEGRYALLVVTDTGSGMSRDTINKIFDPFFTTKFTGRGLGLSAVLGIIQGHKGGISVESIEGAGTAFRIVLPVVPSPNPGEESVLVERSKEPAAGTMILVVDDEEDVAAMAKEMLEAGHYRASFELLPARGIEFYRQHRSEIGMVLVDLTMPEMSGKEVVEALHAIDPDVKVIITSGYSEEDVTRKIGNAKVSAFIQKPYRLQSLLSIVHTVMHDRNSPMGGATIYST